MIAPVAAIDAWLARHGEDVRVTAIPLSDRRAATREATTAFDDLRARIAARVSTCPPSCPAT